MNAREQIIQALMGKHIHVEVDRPMGYQHGNIIYPINYGYVPGIIAEDGEAQDAYILGVSKPISSFDGQVIGVIRRKNDCEDKLVVAPEGILFHQGEIAQAVHFQEQYFDITVDCLFRKSCGVIPYRSNGSQREYLILLQNNNSWSFPKGHMEAGETETETALRELAEETGLEAKLIPGASVDYSYNISPLVCKQVLLFLGEVDGDVIPQEKEILGYRWVTSQALQAYLHTDTYAACKALLR
jgi:8-oxo-dGTP pyrophosphatase MutT (NUDIX family)